MNPNDVCSILDGHCHGGQGSFFPLIRGKVENPADEGFPGSPEEEGLVQGFEALKVLQQD
jgi:predicted MPP superfamily phosphohydrolase